MNARARVFLWSLFAASVSAGETWSAAVCRFESLPNMAERPVISGTVTRTPGGAIIEYDAGMNTIALICRPSPDQCKSENQNDRTVVDFSYIGFMVINTYIPRLDLDVIGLARLSCSSS